MAKEKTNGNLFIIVSICTALTVAAILIYAEGPFIDAALETPCDVE